MLRYRNIRLYDNNDPPHAQRGHERNSLKNITKQVCFYISAHSGVVTSIAFSPGNLLIVLISEIHF